MNETIWCIAHRCAISPEGCVTRQKNAGKGRPGMAAVGHPGVGDFACRDCEQGRLVAAAMREERKRMGKSSEQPAEKAPAVKVCADPACERAGVPQPIENSGRNYRSADGRKHICRDCQSRRIREGWSHKAGAGETAVQEDGKPREKGSHGGLPRRAAAAPRRPETGSRTPLERRNLMLIDFSGNDELLEKIRAIAAQELRTPEMQVLYWIRQHNLAA